MKRILLLLWLCCQFPSANGQLARSAGFWGLHFDFHAGLTDERVGERLTPGQVDSLLVAPGPISYRSIARGTLA